MQIKVVAYFLLAVVASVGLWYYDKSSAKQDQDENAGLGRKIGKGVYVGEEAQVDKAMPLLSREEAEQKLNLKAISPATEAGPPAGKAVLDSPGREIGPEIADKKVEMELPSVDAGEPKAETEIPSSPPLTMNTPLTGKFYPYRINALPGWAILQDTSDLALALGEEIQIHIRVSPRGIDNKTYANKEVERLKAAYLGLQMEEQDIVEIGRQTWGRFEFNHSNAAQRSRLLHTHAGDKGCYTIEVVGEKTALREQQAAVNRIVQSFRFPPDNLNYGPVQRVRVELPE